MRILLAEDEAQLSRVLKVALAKNGHQVDAVENGRQAVEMNRQHIYDVIILDIMMPVMNGLDALREIRKSGDKTYVIMLTAMAEVDDRVVGLDAGADDYITKPFSLKELLARLRSLERRVDVSFTPKILKYGDLTLDLEEQELVSQNTIRLANKETKLLEFLILNVGKNLTSQEILQHVWEDDNQADEQTVWIYISYLRQKFNSVNTSVMIEGKKGMSFSLSQVA